MDDRKREALDAAWSRFPSAERVVIHTFYAGDFYAAVRMPGDRYERVGVANPGAED